MRLSLRFSLSLDLCLFFGKKRRQLFLKKRKGYPESESEDRIGDPTLHSSCLTTLSDSDRLFFLKKKFFFKILVAIANKRKKKKKDVPSHLEEEILKVGNEFKKLFRSGANFRTTSGQ
jgi:hypothetical protein